MRVWLITVGEPLPGLSSGARLWRTGLLAEQLVARGHEVVWWTSNVDHFRKVLFTRQGGTVAVPTQPLLTLRLLTGVLYRRNVSLTRLLNHWQIARRFRSQARAAPRPDVVLCSFPTIELADEGVAIGREWGVDIVIDVRDLWPDIFLTNLPPVVRGLARIGLSYYFTAARRVLRNADAIIGASPQYLAWGLRQAQRPPGKDDRVFPLGYDFPPIAPIDAGTRQAIVSRFGLEVDSIVCIFAGTMGRTYDLRPVIEAARQMAEKTALHIQFLICGDGERAAEWRAMADGAPNVLFAGWLDQEDMRAALRVSHLGLAAYAGDAPQGVPNKIIEYLAASLPVVSSLCGESAELLARNDCGVSYKAGDSEDLINVLTALASDDRRLELARNARRTFEQQFRAEVVYAELATYLEERARLSVRD